MSTSDATWLVAKMPALRALLGQHAEHWTKRDTEKGKLTLYDALRRIAGQRKGTTSGSIERRSRLLAQFFAEQIRLSFPAWDDLESEIRRHLSAEEAKSQVPSEELVRRFEWYIIKRFNDIASTQDLLSLLTLSENRARDLMQGSARLDDKALPDDIREWLHTLTTKSVFIHFTHIDAADPLSHIGALVQQDVYRLQPEQVKKILNQVTRWLNQAMQGKSNAVFTVPTINMAAKCFFVLLRSLQDASSIKAVLPFYKRCESTMFEMCRRGDRLFGWLFFLDFLNYTGDASGLPLRKRVSSENLGPRFSEIRDALKAGLINALHVGQTDEAGLINAYITRHDDLSSSIKESLIAEYKNRPAMFPAISQEWMLRVLNIRTQAPLQYASPWENPVIRQAAIILLRFWDVSNDEKISGLFADYQALALAQFHIQLHGTPGDIVEYDPRFHEPSNEMAAGRVRVVRPGVEWSEPPNSSVVIRSLVTAI